MNIAIVGTGISGLTSAYLLNRKHDVTVFEANNYIGGHTATVDVEVESGRYAIDTGFIVFNDRTYPKFCRLTDILRVESQSTDMSFSVKREDNDLEYKTTDLNSLFAQRSNILRPSFWGMVMGMVRFGKELESDYQEGLLTKEMTLADWLRTHNFSQYLIENFIIPIGAAIWSAGEDDFLDFPILTYTQFMHNHGMLTVNDHPRWRVIKGGSRTYVEPLILSFRDKIRLESPVTSVERNEDGVWLDSRHGRERFDHVVLATHSDISLKLLTDASDEEREVLEALPYQKNDVVLHTDSSLMPKRELAWASWNYLVPREARNVATLTYNMNILQGIESPEDFLVTLNSRDQIDPERILASFTYDHPVYSPAGQAAQGRWAEISGVNRTHYAGAYWRFGFHEDGVMSALRVCEQFGEGL